MQQNLNVHSLKLFKFVSKNTWPLLEDRNYTSTSKNKIVRKSESISKRKIYFHSLVTIPQIQQSPNNLPWGKSRNPQDLSSYSFSKRFCWQQVVSPIPETELSVCKLVWWEVQVVSLHAWRQEQPWALGFTMGQLGLTSLCFTLGILQKEQHYIFYLNATGF